MPMFSSNVTEFVNATKNGSAECRIAIKRVPEFLAKLLVCRDSPDNAWPDLISKCLVGICPECHIESMGQGLLMLKFYMDVGGKRATVRFYGGTGGFLRLTRGLCRNEACSCKEILLSWRPEGIGKIQASKEQESILPMTPMQIMQEMEKTQQLKHLIKIRGKVEQLTSTRYAASHYNT